MHGFLAEGHKVKITIMFRGREMQHPELGRRILDRVAEHVVDVGRVEVMPKQDGRNMTMVLGPDKKAQAAAARRQPKPRRRGRTDDTEPTVEARTGRHRQPVEAEPHHQHPPPRPRRRQPARPLRPRPEPSPITQSTTGAARPPRHDTETDTMPKMKTHSGAKKRYKITGTGKIMRRR